MKSCKTIIFSRNRSLQLDLCLKTLLNHCSDILEVSDIAVLYRNDEEYRKSFDNLMSEFPQISFKCEENFKKDLLSLLSHENNISWGNIPPYMVVFIVDDTIFTDDFSMKEVISTFVENKDCLGFSLRLGKNCIKCFPYNCNQNIPEMIDIKNNIKKFDWQKAEYDFSYPLELSSSCYLLEDLREILENCNYHNPNTLESVLASCYFQNKPNLLCYEKGIAFCNPINKVQDYNNNRSGNIDPIMLNKKYLSGYRIDENKFNKYQNDGVHELVGIMLKKERSTDEN